MRMNLPFDDKRSVRRNLHGAVTFVLVSVATMKKPQKCSESYLAQRVIELPGDRSVYPSIL